MTTVNFSGAAYASVITITETSADPRDLAATWRAGRAGIDFNQGDQAVLFAAPAIAGAPRLCLSSEGAIEWYARQAGGTGNVALPGVSRMFLGNPLEGAAYALVFHPNKDCATKATQYAAGNNAVDAVADGGVGPYSATAQPDVLFAVRAATDGTITACLRALTAAQQVRLFERAAGGLVRQNVLLATVAKGQTLLFEFTPSPLFAPFVDPTAMPLVGVMTASSEDVGPTRVMALGGTIMFKDVSFGGAGTLSGSTRIKAEGADLPTMARVSLLHAKTKVLVRQTWSDPKTGAFTFTGLDTSAHYIALAEYPANPDDPAAENYMRPVAGVSPVQVLL